jgi:hypothetical protein
MLSTCFWVLRESRHKGGDSDGLNSHLGRETGKENWKTIEYLRQHILTNHLEQFTQFIHTSK